MYLKEFNWIISGFMLLISDSDPWLNATASAEKIADCCFSIMNKRGSSNTLT